MVYARSDDFFAMLGYGPLGEGYSLLATREHIPSMLDVDAELVSQLTGFSATVRHILEPHYGPVSMTEHGRVRVCMTPAVQRHEPHCLHAHRLVFPGIDEVGAVDGEGGTFPDFAAAHSAWRGNGPYLYSESADGAIAIVDAPRELPRQFFRGIVAVRRGEPEMADWARRPRLELVEAARQTLGLTS